MPVQTQIEVIVYTQEDAGKPQEHADVPWNFVHLLEVRFVWVLRPKFTLANYIDVCRFTGRVSFGKTCSKHVTHGLKCTSATVF